MQTPQSTGHVAFKMSPVISTSQRSASTLQSGHGSPTPLHLMAPTVVVVVVVVFVVVVLVDVVWMHDSHLSLQVSDTWAPIPASSQDSCGNESHATGSETPLQCGVVIMVVVVVVVEVVVTVVLVSVAEVVVVVAVTVLVVSDAAGHKPQRSRHCSRTLVTV